MKKIIKDIKNNEKGAISTLVLFTILMFIVILMGSFLSITTMQKAQLKSDIRIQEIYGQEVDKVDEIYNEIYQQMLDNYITYEYTGDVQTFIVPYTGTYKIECWGAQGGDIDTFTGGKGAYTKGEIILDKGTILYIYVGGEGDNTVEGGYNGGASLTAGEEAFGSSGGGATDIRLSGGDWNDSDGLKSRIMVAAGGGGANNRNRADSSCMYGAGNGGAGGELTGESGTSVNYLATDSIPTYNAHNIGTGATQIKGGSLIRYDSNETIISTQITGSFGNANTESLRVQSGGGSGYYGGGVGGHGGAGGGSSFISGHDGCDAIDSNGTHTGQSNHFLGYIFSNTQMIAGSKEMPKTEGEGNQVGKSGNGFVKISRIK